MLFIREHLAAQQDVVGGRRASQYLHQHSTWEIGDV